VQCLLGWEGKKDGEIVQRSEKILRTHNQGNANQYAQVNNIDDSSEERNFKETSQKKEKSRRGVSGLGGR